MAVAINAPQLGAIRDMSLKVWSKAMKDTAVGATASFVDSGNTITLRTGCQRIGGIIVSIGSATPTSAQNAIPAIRVNSDPLGWSNRALQLPMSTGDGIATNMGAIGRRSFFIPITNLKPPANPAIGFQGVTITFGFKTANAAYTGGWDVAISVLQLNVEPDEAFAMALQTQMMEFCHNFAEGNGATGAGSAARNEFTNNPALTVNDTLLTGVQPVISPNAAATTESAVGIVNLDDSDIVDFSPQEWPCCISYDSSLGTATMIVPAGEGKAFPTRFPLPGQQTTVTASIELAKLRAAACDAGITLYTRQD